MASVQVRVISDETAKFWELEGLIDKPINNKRTISVALLSTPSSSRSSSGTISSADFTASNYHELKDEVEIPVVLESRETLVFIGLHPDTASQLFTTWERLEVEDDPNFSISLIDLACEHVENCPVDDAETAADDWRSCLEALSVNERLTEAIMDPDFEELRYTAPCKFWVQDTFRVAYEGLERLEGNLKSKKEQFSRHGMKRTKHAGSISEVPSLPSPRSQERISGLPRSPLSPDTASESTQAMAVSEQAEVSEPSQPVLGQAVEAPMSIPGMTMLWRASASAKIDQFLRADGSLNFINQGYIRGDFSPDKSLAYFTPQKETADQYATWAKKKAIGTEISILQMAVPDSSLQGLSIKYLRYSDRSQPTDEWKKLIWCGRKGEELLDDIAYIADMAIIIGHIASARNKKLLKMESWTKVNESHLMMVESGGEQRAAIQLVFQTTPARKAIDVACRGMVWIHSLGTYLYPTTPVFQYQ
ncbi:hypothetical protein MMC06_003886 [Schaereria dolodes]|nr:hypothetical protein [Schaereria dolodes]